ncbi:MAG: putative transposase [Myxococcota bacterium]
MVFQPIFAIFIVKHATREVLHVDVTRTSTDRWVTQQLREATPFGQGPKFLIRDNDGKFGAQFAAVAEGSAIEVLRIPPRCPNLNAICERYLGSLRRECLDHIIILSESHLRRVLDEYVRVYFNKARSRQGLSQRIAAGHAMGPPGAGCDNVFGLPVL